MADTLDLIWGAANIAAFINKTERATFQMLERGDIPVAVKRGGRWVVSRQKLKEFFEGEAA